MRKDRKLILVTGPTGGIGSRLCEHLAGKGYDLFLVARNIEHLSKLSSSLATRFPGQSFLFDKLDFSDFFSIKDCAKRFADTGSKLSGLVLMPPQVAATDDCMPLPEEWETIHRQSFVGPLELVKAFLPAFSQSIRGKIVVVSGISSAQVLGHYATSNVLRLAWLAEAKTLAFALGPRGIHVNTVSFGGVMTPKYQSRIEAKAQVRGVTISEQMAEEVANVPLRKYASTEEAATVIEGLLSSFSDHLTGINLLCDGGFTRAY